MNFSQTLGFAITSKIPNTGKIVQITGSTICGFLLLYVNGTAQYMQYIKYCNFVRNNLEKTFFLVRWAFF
jgi:hypothetical protein